MNFGVAWIQENLSFSVYIKTDDIQKDTAEDVETRFDTSNYYLDRPKGKNQKVIGLMEDEFEGKSLQDLLD